MVTEAQKKATAKYNKNNYDTIYVRVPKGDREKIRDFAESQGKSLNQFIADLLHKEMNK